MSADTTLYVAWPEGDEAVVGRVLEWTRLDPDVIYPRPVVALEVPGCPEVYDRVHLLPLQSLHEAVVSEDPEAARSAINLRLVGEWADSYEAPEGDADVLDLEEPA